jgi:ADP-heptose:LPS heptosyltransferase
VLFARQPAGLPGVQRDPLEALRRGVHMADWLARAIEPEARDCQPALDVEPGDGAGLVIHPGAGGAAKRWRAERFARLARRLSLDLAVVQGPADPAFELSEPHQLWRDLHMPEVARRIRGSRLFVGNDSGITHLAAAVGTPTLAIYVSTDPAVWGVRGPRTRRLAGDVQVEQALAACLELLAAGRG